MTRNIITLRSVFGKVKTYHFSPLKGKNGLYPPCVKRVRINSNGDSEMILSEAEMNSPERNYFIPEDLEIVVEDGTEFNLDDPYEANQWEAIKNSVLIVPDRGARDAEGNLIIDGDKKRYGLAELYIDRPGEESTKRVSRMKLVTKAYNFIEQDSPSNRLTKVKLLGKAMRNAPDSDVQDWLYQQADKNPELIIELYTGADTHLKLLFIDATERSPQIIRKINGVFMYGDTVLGVTDESVLLFLKDPKNVRILDSIKMETYPDFLQPKSVETPKVEAEPAEEPASPKPAGRKTTK